MTSMKLLFVFWAVCASAFVTVPQPSGPYGVSLVEYVLNDTTRADPYNGKPYRLLPVTVIAPSGPASSCQSILRPLMTNATAQYWAQMLSNQTHLPLQDIFGEIYLSLCSSQKTENQYPTIFFSPAAEAPSEWYSILTTNIAAQGYVVVQVGVPGEVSFIQFPDGRIERGNISLTTLEQLAASQDVRVKDISFVLDQLSSPSVELGCITTNMDSSSPSLFGHSFGGSTSLATLAVDQRFVAGANADGVFWDAALNATTDRPFMILASTPNNTVKTLSATPNWAGVWSHLHGPKSLISINNTVHRSFINVNLIAEYQGLSNYPEVGQFLGQIDPHEMLRIQVALFSDWARYSGGMWEGQNITNITESFQQVSILNSSSSGLV